MDRLILGISLRDNFLKEELRRKNGVNDILQRIELSGIPYSKINQRQMDYDMANQGQLNEA